MNLLPSWIRISLLLLIGTTLFARSSAFALRSRTYHPGHPKNVSAKNGFDGIATNERTLYVRENSIGGTENHDTKLLATSSNEDTGRQGTLLGSLVLLSVPLSWGTYGPVVRYLYKIDPPVPGFVFSACYYLLAAITTSVLARKQSRSIPSEIDNKDAGESTEDFSIGSVIPFMGGIELGMYLFVANCLQVIGLQTVESDRAGFLVQLTTVMVPVCEGLFAGSVFYIPVRTWGACILAFSGLCVMGLEGKTVALLNGDSLLNAVFSQGDFLILGAAVLYTLHVVRLGTYARQTTPIILAASKAVTESILSFALVGALVGLSVFQDVFHIVDSTATKSGLLSFTISTGEEIRSFFSAFSTGLSDGSLTTPVLLPALGAILWTGWVTCAYTIWAQSFGQSKVSPTSANLIYTFQPIFTAIFAYVLLGEKMGPMGFLGGSIIASAVYIAASNESYNSDTNGS